MDFNKFKHSKCPNCGNYSLPISKIHKTHNPVFECPHCKKKYKVNRFISYIFSGVIFVLFFVVYNFFNSIINISVWIYYILCVIGFIIFEYFAPLEEVSE